LPTVATQPEHHIIFYTFRHYLVDVRAETDRCDYIS